MSQQQRSPSKNATPSAAASSGPSTASNASTNNQSNSSNRPSTLSAPSNDSGRIPYPQHSPLSSTRMVSTSTVPSSPSTRGRSPLRSYDLYAYDEVIPDDVMEKERLRRQALDIHEQASAEDTFFFVEESFMEPTQYADDGFMVVPEPPAANPDFGLPPHKRSDFIPPTTLTPLDTDTDSHGPKDDRSDSTQLPADTTGAIITLDVEDNLKVVEEKVQKTPLYPIGKNFKRDHTLSPAQQLDPTKIFDADVNICYRDVNVKVRVSAKERVDNVLTPVCDLFDGIRTGCASCKRKDFYRIKDVSGVIRPGTMTLVLSGPGEGKSTYLRALGNRIELSSGRVVYNGRDAKQAEKEKIDLTKMVQYVDQTDNHLALLTVHETLDFAHKMTSVKYDPQRVEDIITLLGLEECRDTIIGNQQIRGVSGGQRKRVTIGELLVSDASTLFLDEYSNGLDSSTAEDIGKGLVKFCRKYNNSIVATLQQPTPELFALFDRLVVLREGQVVFDGPVEDVVPFFAGMGFNAPDDVDTADFLVDCLSQPRSVILRQKQEEAFKLKKQKKEEQQRLQHEQEEFQRRNPQEYERQQESNRQQSQALQEQWEFNQSHPLSPNPLQQQPTISSRKKSRKRANNNPNSPSSPTNHSLQLSVSGATAFPSSTSMTFITNSITSQSFAKPKHHKPSTVDTSYGPIQVSRSPCITTEEMIEYYKTTPQWKEIEETLDRDLPAATQFDRKNNPTYPPLDLSNYKSLKPTEDSKEMYGLGYRLPIFTLLMYVAAREAKVFFRNRSTIISRIGTAIIMSLVYGSLYWSIGPDEYVLRLASSTIAVAQVAFANFVNISLAAKNAFVVKKQLAAKFYPAWTYTLSTWLTALPMSFIEATIYSLFLYFMYNSYRAAKEFFLFWSTLLCVSILLSAWFRCLAVIGGDESTAQALAPSTTGVMMVFGGLFVTKNNIPIWLRWLYWCTPFSFSVRSIVNIEFLSPRYDEIVVNAAGDNVRLGDMYLQTVNFDISIWWVLWGALYLIGLSFFIVGLNAFLLPTKWYEESIGTRRSNDQEIVEIESLEDMKNDVNDEMLKAAVQAAAMQQYTIQHEQSRIRHDDEPSRIDITATDAAMGSGGANSNLALRALRENIPFTPAWLSFTGVSYSVKVKKDKQTVDRMLLNNVNGYAQPGKMLALMGASGAGKTTLLDVIAGLKNTGHVEGNILINGQPATKQLLSAMTGYVEQFDTLYAYQTVYETLLFAARLRLPRSVTDKVKKEIVDEIIEILDLGSIKDYVIGNAKIQGLSPAQSKRVNIGVELVANPSILFLDEPTTGLDSKSAQTVIKVVKRIARSGRAIICTIHQPSAELFFLFDRLLLLGAGGFQIYFGDLGRRAHHFVKYLSRCPGVTPIKPRVNPASWMLIELGVGVAAEKGDTTARLQGAHAVEGQVEIEDEPEWEELTPPQRTVQKFCKMYKMSKEWEITQKRLKVLESIEIIHHTDTAGMVRYNQELELAQIKLYQPKSSDAGLINQENEINLQRANSLDYNNNNNNNNDPSSQNSKHNNNDNQPEYSTTRLPTTTIVIPPKVRPYWFKQLAYLYVRNTSGYYRNQSFIYYRLTVQTLLSLIFGLIYFDSHATDVASANSLIGAIFMGIQFSTMVVVTTDAALFAEGKITFTREKAGGYYIPLLWAVCQLTIEMVWLIPSLVVTVIPIYFMVGLIQDVGTFFTYVFFTYMLFLVYVTIAMFFVSITANSGQASIVAGAFLSLSKALSGVAITSKNIPRGWKWLYHALPLPHVLQALIVPQLRDNNTPMKYFRNGILIDTTVSEYASNYLGWSFTQVVWKQMIWIGIFFVVFQLGTYLATSLLSFHKR